jgi:hypothetical protein
VVGFNLDERIADWLDAEQARNPMFNKSEWANTALRTALQEHDEAVRAREVEQAQRDAAEAVAHAESLAKQHTEATRMEQEKALNEEEVAALAAKRDAASLRNDTWKRQSDAHREAANRAYIQLRDKGEINKGLSGSTLSQIDALDRVIDLARDIYAKEHPDRPELR